MEVAAAELKDTGVGGSHEGMPTLYNTPPGVLTLYTIGAMLQHGAVRVPGAIVFIARVSG